MSGEKPLVSAIIATWNGERFIKETIDSVLNQNYPNLEVIVVDDGSTDSTQLICLSYGASIRYFRQHKDNKHGVTAYVRALKEAKGKYIAPIDHDDRWLREKIARQVDVMEKNPEVGVSFTRFIVIDEHSSSQGVSSLTGQSGDVYHLLLGGNKFCHASAMYRPEVVEKIGGVAIDTGIGDWDLWLRIAREYPVIMLDEPLTEYRVHDRGYSTDLLRMARATRCVLDNQASRLHPDCWQCRASMAAGMRVVAEAYLQHFHNEARRGRRGALRSFGDAVRTSPAAVFNRRQLAATAKSMTYAGLGLLRTRPRRWDG